MAAKTIKMCDMAVQIAAKVFSMLNLGKIDIECKGSWLDGEFQIVTEFDPEDLIYPEGWYYAKGYFTNKHESTTGIYQQAIMLKPNGKEWKETAKYCTLDE